MSPAMTELAGERPALSILIVNFNSTPLLTECLDAIAASTIADQLEVIVVDNASSDFDASTLAPRFPWVVWLPQTTNTTYTGGNNIAFRHASAELILMLNPDTRPEPEALEYAVAHMTDSPDLAGIGAFLIGPDGRLQRYYRKLPRLADLPVLLFEPLLRRTGRARRFLMLDEPFASPTPVENTPGAFTLVRRSLLGEQLLDPGYYNFVSDLELCDRMNRAGPIVVFPDVRVHHHRAGAGVGTQDPYARLRLYHDLTWGLRRFFRSRGLAASGILNTLLIAYWAVRITRVAAHRPLTIAGALRSAADALSGRPPTY